MNKISVMPPMPHSPYAMTPLLAALLLAFSPLAAEAAGQAVPDAGAILKQVQPAMPPAPSPDRTGLLIEPQGGVKLPASAPFLVTAIRIAGNTQFDTPTLHALVADAEGKTLTLDALGEAAARITDFYRRRGYVLARAIIPAQGIRDGVVTLRVIEAHYGMIGLDNRSRVNYSLMEATLATLQSGQVISQTEMERALLLLFDIPGVAFNATLKPGERVGSSDLLVYLTPGPAVSGQAVLDNDGNRYTGRTRLSGTAHLINPLRHGDILSVSGLSSGRGTNYGRLAYDILLNGQGSHIGISYSALHYRLGGPLAALDARGTAQVANLSARQTLVRSRNVNLYGQIQYDRLQLRDHIGANAIDTDRHLGNWTLSLTGDMRDGILSGAVSLLNASWTTGRVGFDNAAAQLADLASARTQGRFSKRNVNLARLQSLGSRDSVYLSIAAQWTNGNLDASQKMTAGGPYTVRAYDVGAISGDTGYLGSAEWRHDLGPAWGGQWQAVAFVDSARITVNKNVWVAGENGATLSGAGVGLNWTGSKRWSAKTYLAAPIGRTPVLAADGASVRAWVEIARAF